MKKFISMGLALVLATGILTGCSTSDKAEETTTENKTEIPSYLQNEYVIQEGEHLTCLDSLLAWYWTNYSFLKENLDCSESVFIEKIKNCKTMEEMKKLVNQYV